MFGPDMGQEKWTAKRRKLHPVRLSGRIRVHCVVPQEVSVQKNQITITCPLCGRNNDHRLENLREGEDLICSHCGVKLNLHGHMWEDIRDQIAKMKAED